MPEESLHRQNIVACLWDFDKTLGPGYMQRPIFDYYGLDEEEFWREVNGLEAHYRARGQIVARDILYLNHLLTHVRHGRMPGLNNALLRRLGARLPLFPGLPEFFPELKQMVARQPDFARYDIRLEHYIITTGLGEMVRGHSIAEHVEAVYGCEFIEQPAPPRYASQPELPMEGPVEIAQIGRLVDNTIKTRYVFEINKGSNKIESIDVNAKVAAQDRRIPIRNMIYIADGPSDVPVFAVLRKNGGRAYAVYESGNEAEFVQNDELRRTGRVDHFGRADYRPKSDTHLWLTTHVKQICQRIVEECEQALLRRVSSPPRHLHREVLHPPAPPLNPQPELPMA